MRQVIVILKDCSDSTFDMSCLFDRKSIRDKWLISFEIKRKPGTVKSYIHSLRFFYKFIISDEPLECSKYKGKCSSLVIMCDNWITVYRKKSRKTRWRRDVEQLSQLFKASEIKTLDKSDLVQYCKKTLKTFSCSEIQHATLKHFSNSRDYLLMYLCLDNASRTGALANMTLNELQKAMFDGGVYKVAVVDHKTLETSGPAIIVFTSDLYKEARTYVQYMRNKLEGINCVDKSATVFLSWSGRKMSSSMVTAQINSFWGKAVGHSLDRPRINATLVRKSAVSKVHELRKDQKSNLADLMCHSESTAKKSYFIKEKTQKAGETSALLRSVIRQADPVEHLEAAIDKHFAEEISNGKISLAIVKEKENLSPAFQNLTETSLRDKIRYIISQRQGGKGIILSYKLVFLLKMIVR